MSILKFLSFLRDHGVKLWVEGNQLCYRAPAESLPSNILSLLKERKEEILNFLLEADQKVKSTLPPICPVSRTEGKKIPLSYAQERLWFFDQLQPDSTAYNLPGTFRINGALNVGVLERVINEIVRRHEILRTIYDVENGEPVQVIHEARWSVLPMVDLEGLGRETVEGEARRLAREEAGRGFDLKKGPVVRTSIMRLGLQEHAILYTMHHIASDGWSMGVMNREIGQLYIAYTKGEHSPLLDLPIQYADYAIWQKGWLQGEILEKQMVYWKKQLEGLSQLQLPEDHPRPVMQTFRGGIQGLRISREVSEGLKELSRREGVTLYMTLLAGFQVLLSRYCGQEDIAIGSPIANRNREEIEGLIGFFVNTLVMRTDLGGNPTVEELLKRVREVTLGAYGHQDLPFEKLVEGLRFERDMSRNALVQVILELQNTPDERVDLTGIRLESIEGAEATTRWDLELHLRQHQEGLVGSVVYNRDLFEKETIGRMLGHLERVLEGFVKNPKQRLSELEILSEAERQQILLQWNDTQTKYPKDKCVNQVFEEQVEKNPEAVAVVYEGAQLTYQELNRRANQLAHYLKQLGVGPEVLVGIFVERSIEMVVGLLGILKAGGAYVPMDPAYPQERLMFMIEDSQVTMLLTQERLVEKLPTSLAQVVCLDEHQGRIFEESMENPFNEAVPSNAIYVMYTSGSTGRPKGSTIIHRNVIRLVHGANYVSLGADEKILQMAPISFDASTFEIWGALLTGGQLVVMPAGAFSTEQLEEVLLERGVSTLWLTASLFHQVVGSHLEGLSPVRQLLAGGDVLLASHCRKFLGNQRGQRLINGYGPTEGTTFSCCNVMSQMDEVGNSVSIGRPINNTAVYVLDHALNPVPVGARGELYISGDGLARGYLDRPQLTAEKFIPDPFGNQAGGRMYRTGDLVRYLPEGKIEFFGRRDHQVKIRGHRIELGEVEAVLANQSSVREAVVTVKEDEPGEKRLIAYLVLAEGSQIDRGDIRNYLKEKLPDYMMPSAFVFLEKFPLTANGKVDRKSLPEPEVERQLEKEHGVPRTPVEELLVGVWEKVLKLEGVGIDENFFELGGHSLWATQVISRVREVFEVELPIQAIFEAPTIRELAGRVEGAREEGKRLSVAPLISVGRDRNLPLSFAQERLWFLAQLEPNSAAYNIGGLVWLQGDLNIEALARAMNEIVRRHEVLRTTFAMLEGKPVQVIQANEPMYLPIVDLEGFDGNEQMSEVRRLGVEEYQKPFDLSRGPLMRLRLLRLGKGEHIVLYTMHHIVSDLWSQGVLDREVNILYEAYVQGQPSPLPELAIQYADYAVWQRGWFSGAVLEKQLNYWKKQLAGVSGVLEISTDYPRPAVQTFNGTVRELLISEDLWHGLKELSRKEGATLFMTGIAAFNVLLHRYSGQKDIVIGTPIANRNWVEIEPLIGFFVNTVVLRFDISSDQTFLELLKQVREVSLEAYANQDLPFEQLVHELQIKRDASRSPLFQVMCAMQNVLTRAKKPMNHVTPVSGSQAKQLNMEWRTAKFDLSLGMMESESGFKVVLEYNTDLFKASTIDRMLADLVKVFEAVLTNAEDSLSTIINSNDLAVFSSKTVKRDLPTIEDIQERSNLTKDQYIIWMGQKLDLNTPHYNIPFSYTFLERVELSHFQNAFQTLVNSSDVLRTVFMEVDEVPQRQVLPELSASMEYLDFSKEPEPEAVFRDWSRQRLRLPFNLGKCPFDSVMVKISEEKFTWYLCAHHLISDGFSQTLILRRMIELYALSVQGRLPKVVQLPQFSDFVDDEIASQNTSRYLGDKKYWNDKFANPVSPISFYGKVASHIDLRANRLKYDLGAERTSKLRSIASQKEFFVKTLDMSLLSILGGILFTYLHRVSGNHDLSVGVVFGNRLKAFRDTIGLFTSVLPFRITIEEDETFITLVKKVAAEISESLRHRQYVYDSPLRNKAFDVVLNYYAKSFDFNYEKVITEWIYPEHGHLSMDVGVRADITPESLIFYFDLLCDVFEGEQGRLAARHLFQIVDAFLEDSKQSIHEFSLFSPQENQHFISDFNRTDSVVPDYRNIVEVFDLQAEATPERIAVRYKNQSITFGKLSKVTNQLAHYLRKLGVGPEVFVGICLERSLGLVVGALGVMKAGGAYVPLDPIYPRERLNFMLSDSKLSVLLTEQKSVTGLQTGDACVVDLDRDWPLVAEESEKRPVVNICSDNVAYMIYTSGSTGLPKGVMISHQSYINVYFAYDKAYKLRATCTTHLQMANFSFDVFCGDLVRSLCSGAKLVLCPQEWVSDPEKLYWLIMDERIDCAEFVPGVIRNVVSYLEDTDQSLDYMEVLVVSSDVWFVKEFIKIRSLCGVSTRLTNVYGATEATIDSMHFGSGQIMLPAESAVPLGSPLFNNQLYILDRFLQPVPVGVAGEIHIGGIGLARGYLSRPELTAERFIPDPFSKKPGGRLYKTGDLGRYATTGEVEFLCRMDHQVKIRGLRIELGEIEAVLGGHPGVLQNVVLIAGETDDKQIVAYIVPNPAEVPTIGELKTFLKGKLPAYMVPSNFAMLKSLPLTTNGKVDRRALAEIKLVKEVVEESGPRKPKEEILANIWCQVLNLERIGLHDDFFEMGGHSLIATKLISRIREAFGIELPLRVLFEHPTIAEIAQSLEAAVGIEGIPCAPPLVQVDRNRAIPLSFAQERLWFLDQLEPGSSVYNVPIVIRVNEGLNIAALEKALNEIQRRHEVLRTVFGVEEGRAVQVIRPYREEKLSIIDAGDIGQGRIGQLIAEESGRPFDLKEGPVVRASLIHLNGQENIVLYTMHHIVSDEWSGEVLNREIGALYKSYSEGKESPLEELSIQYADYAIWQRSWLQGEVLEKQVSYWKKQLGGSPEYLALPTDWPRPAIQTYAGAAQEIKFSLPILNALKALCQRESATLFMALLTAVKALLYRYTAQTDIVVGTQIANRNQKEIEGLIGFFVNTLVLRSDLSGEPTFLELMRRVRDTALGAYDHQDLPFEKLVEELQPVRDLSYHPLFQVSFGLQTGVIKAGKSEEQLKPVAFGNRTSKFDLSIDLVESDSGLVGGVEYSTDLFESATIRRMVQHLGRLLEGIAENPGQKLSQMPLLTSAECDQLLNEFRGELHAYPVTKTLHQIFQEKAAAAPERIAAVHGKEKITYRELNERANRIAHFLRRLGLKPNEFVGVLDERGIDFLTAILGVLKSGGAYIPIDADYPEERIGAILANSRSHTLILRSDLAAKVSFEKAKGCLRNILCLDSGTNIEGLTVLKENRSVNFYSIQDLAKECENDPDPVNESHDLAYMVYTSGSTGVPKGAMLRHNGAINHIFAEFEELDFHADTKFLQSAPCSSDISVWQFLAPLLIGGRTVIVDFETVCDPAELLGVIRSERITLIELVPPVLKGLLDHAAKLGPKNRALPDLEYAMVSGEAVPVPLVNQWFDCYPDIKLVNAYGPAEASDDISQHVMDRPLSSGARSVPIGKPLANLTLYVLDKDLGLLPIGIPGEICVAGIGVGAGYWCEEEKTRTSFVFNPHAQDEYSKVLYRTGDLGRWLANGTLEFLGRKDYQVKIRGFRIELGEIEAVINQHEKVRESVVVMREDEVENRKLVAYVVPGNRSGPVDYEETADHASQRKEGVGNSLQKAAEGELVSELREYLKCKLPDHMVPSAIVALEKLPLNPNGKVDRKRLPAPKLGRQMESEYTAPRMPIEKVLTEIWMKVLRVEKVGVRDNFFELGGDSILSIQIISRAREAGLQLTPRQLFKNQTIAELAAVAGKGVQAKAEQDVVSGPAVMTPIQRWFFEQEWVESHHYNQSVMLEVDEKVKAEQVRQVVQELVRHHDVLRMRYSVDQNGWLQINAAEEKNEIFVRMDLSGVEESKQQEVLSAEAGRMQGSLNLEKGPIIRVAWFEMGTGRSARLLLVIHHLVVDGVSWRILLEDLQRGCESLIRGEEIGFERKTSSFQQWAVRLQEYARSSEIEKELIYWETVLGKNYGKLPLDYRGENLVSSSQTVTVRLSEGETRTLLQEVPEKYRTQVNDVLLTALLKAFERWTGVYSVLINLEGHGREELFEEMDLTRTVGWFTTLFPVGLELLPEMGVGEALKSVKEQLRRLPGKGIGYGLLRYLNEMGQQKLRGVPEAEIVFNYLGQFDQVLKEEGGIFRGAREDIGSMQGAAQMRECVLDLNGSVMGGRFGMSFGYSKELHQRETIEKFAEGFIKALKEIIEHCQREDAGGYTPSDFPLAGLTQEQLDGLQNNVRIEDIYPCTPVQEGLLFHSLYAPESGVYFDQLTCTLRGELDKEAFKEAWNAVVGRHEILRTSFVWEGLAKPQQLVHKCVELSWEEQDWRKINPSEQQHRLQNFLQEDRRRGFNLDEAPLIRFALFRLSEDRGQFVWSSHHLLLDGWSVPILVKEMFVYYEGLRQGREVKLDKLRPFRDYVAWLQKREIKEAEKFWRERLRGFTKPTTLGSSRGRVIGSEEMGQEIRIISSELTDRLQAVTQSSKVTANSVLQGVWALLLSRYCREQDVMFGTVVSGRPPELSGVEQMVGMFINSLPVRVKVDPEVSVMNWLRLLQEEQVEMREYEFSPLTEIQKWSEVPRDHALFEGILVFYNYPVDETVAQEMSQRQQNLRIENVRTIDRDSYPLSIDVGTGGNLSLKVNYSSERFEAAAIKRMLGHMEQLLSEMIERGESGKIADLDLLTAAERKHLVEELNLAGTNAGEERCWVKLFEEQVERNPQAVAVVFKENRLTYGELNQWSNQVACRLREFGVGPEVLVGLCAERSLEMAVGLLGVMKAGGAYVPIDPKNPLQRIDSVLRDAGVSVLLTQRALEEKLPGQGAILVYLDKTEWDEANDPGNLSSGVSPGNVAYVIYTSGSTGEPKGVMVEHRQLTNYVLGVSERMGLGGKMSYASVSTAAADLGHTMIFPALSWGGTLHLISEVCAADVRLFGEYLKREEIDCLKIVPSHLKALQNGKKGVLPRKRLVLGGEASEWEWVKSMAGDGGGCEIYNHYGPTETTVGVIGVRVTETIKSAGNGTTPLGHPLGQSRIYLLSGQGELVPLGVAGEIYIGGNQVSRGYLNRADLSAERFVPDPFSGEAGSRMYRTGDMGRYQENGTIEFLGRIDNQLKIRGYRIELGEIEAILREHPSVREVAVIAREESGQKSFALSKQPDLHNLSDVDSLNKRLQILDTKIANQLLFEIENLEDENVEPSSADNEQSHVKGKKIMTRKTPEFEVLLQVDENGFAKSLTDSQKNWVLQRTLDEFVDDLKSADELSKRFVKGSNRPEIQEEWGKAQAHYDGTQLIIEGQQVMQDWERPLMKAMAEIATETHGDVLEVGFGMGISASYIQSLGVKSHTIIECNEQVVSVFNKWKAQYPGRDIRLVFGKSQEVSNQLGSYDGVFFDTYPLSEEEYYQYIIKSVTYAEHFFPIAANHLRKGGIFTYYTNEFDSFSRRHQRLLFKYFSSVALSIVKPLSPPEDCNYCWADSMVVVKAIK